MAQKEYNVDDVLISLDLNSKYIFYKIRRKFVENGLTHFGFKPLLTPVDNDFEIVVSLLFLERDYAKVQESTVKILFGDKDGKEKTTPQNSSK